MKKERKKPTFFKEFKEFISKGSVVDLAVGVVVGGAFTAIVNTLVASVITPLINYLVYLLCGGSKSGFNGLDITLIPATLDEEGNVVEAATILSFSNLITAILHFLLVAFTLFCIVKGLNKLRREAEEANKRFETKVKEKISSRKKQSKVEEESEETEEEKSEETENEEA